MAVSRQKQKCGNNSRGSFSCRSGGRRGRTGRGSNPPPSPTVGIFAHLFLLGVRLAIFAYARSSSSSSSGIHAAGPTLSDTSRDVSSMVTTDFLHHSATRSDSGDCTSRDRRSRSCSHDRPPPAGGAGAAISPVGSPYSRDQRSSWSGRSSQQKKLSFFFMCACYRLRSLSDKDTH